MKKTKPVLFLLLIAAMLLSFSACGKKTAITSAQFIEKLEAKGFEEVEIDLDSADEQTKEALKEVKGMVKNGGDDMIVRFYVASDDNKASFLFNGTKELADNAAGSSTATVEKNIGNHSYYRVKGSDLTCILARVDNTLLYVQAKSSLSDEAEDLVKELGYN